jgi:hypothetical protein
VRSRNYLTTSSLLLSYNNWSSTNTYNNVKKLFVIIYTETSILATFKLKSCINLLFVKNHIMSYLSLLVLFLAVITLTIAKSPTLKCPKGLNIYQSPTSDPQKLVALFYGGPTSESSKSIQGPQQAHPNVRIKVIIPNIPHRFHGRRPSRPPP